MGGAGPSCVSRSSETRGGAVVIGKYQGEDAWLLLLRMVGRREGGREAGETPACRM